MTRDSKNFTTFPVYLGLVGCLDSVAQNLALEEILFWEGTECVVQVVINMKTCEDGCHLRVGKRGEIRVGT